MNSSNVYNYVLKPFVKYIYIYGLMIFFPDLVTCTISLVVNRWCSYQIFWYNFIYYYKYAIVKAMPCHAMKMAT